MRVSTDGQKTFGAGIAALATSVMPWPQSWWLAGPLWLLFLWFSWGWWQAAHRERVHLSWVDIEARFNELLARELQNRNDRVHAFEGQGEGAHSNGMRWYVGGGNRQITDAAIDLCVLAGLKLKNDGLASSPRLRRIANDGDRWLWYLVEAGETTADKRYSGSGGGRPENFTYHFSFVLQASLNGCRKLLVNKV